MRCIVPIIEGYGEVAAVPRLLRRLLSDLSVYDVGVGPPINAHGVTALATRFEDFLKLAERRPNCCGVLVLQDCEDGCAKGIAADRVRRIVTRGCKHPVAVAIATRMYEAWLVASIGSIAGTRGIPADASFSGDPEGLSSPKAWLGRHMPSGRAYKETTDQAAMTERMDFGLARTCRSFRRLESALSFLLEHIRTGQGGVDPAPEDLA